MLYVMFVLGFAFCGLCVFLWPWVKRNAPWLVKHWAAIRFIATRYDSKWMMAKIEVEIENERAGLLMLQDNVKYMESKSRNYQASENWKRFSDGLPMAGDLDDDQFSKYLAEKDAEWEKNN